MRPTTHTTPDVVTTPGPALVAPAELAELDQWVTWRLVRRGKKQDKIPYTARTGDPASSTDPSTWASYAEARAASDRVGFVFTAHDPFSGVDIDDCRDPHTREIHPAAQRIIDQLDSYTEVSPSGRGVKIFVRGVLPASVGQSHYPGAPFKVELYSTGRYFTVTGEQLEGTPREIRDAQAALDALYATLRPPRPEPRPVSPTLASGPRVSPGEHGAARLTLADARERFNAQHPLPDLLHRYGAEERPGGFSCPFCEHTHTVTLFISRETGRVFSYSPRCKLHTERGHDSFSLVCLIEHQNDVTAFLRAINPPATRAPREHAPQLTETPEFLTRQHAERRRADAQRKRQARRTSAEELRAEVEARIAADDTLSDNDRAVLQALLTIAGERGWCRPSKPRLAEMSGVPLGSVKRSLMKLERRYIISEGDGGGPNCTAVRTFLRGSLPAAAEPEMIHESYKNTCSEETQRACERGAPSPALGDTPESWSWSDPAIGAADLAEPPPAAELADDAELRYCLLLAAELPGPHPELETLPAAELRAWAEAAERALTAASALMQEPTDDEALHGPDGAVAYQDGAAWLPTDAARAWWEALPKAPRPAPIVLPEPAPEPAPSPVRLGPPSDPAKARRYWALLGKAAKPGTGEKQAAELRRQAAALREPQPIGMAPTAVAAPRSQAPMALEPPSTLPLFAGLDVPTQPAWARLIRMGG
jgi:hypothetical protein